MKKIFLLVIIPLLLSACIKDKSNYDVRPNEEISVEGLQEQYVKVSEIDRITIEPKVSSNKEGADFEYLWGVYETNVQGAIPVLDTIARTKNLDYLVQLPAKTWVLVFKVTNKETGYAAYFDSPVQVVTEFTRGWYVAKSSGDSTDLDLFLTPETIKPDTLLGDIFSQINGKKLAGKAQMLTFMSDYKTFVNGGARATNTRTLFVTTDQDASAVFINTLTEVHDFNGLFYSAPSASPGFIGYGNGGQYFLNDGRLYGIGTISPNSGQFGVPKMKDGKNSPYRLSNYYMAHSRMRNLYVFDETGSSFLGASGGSNMLADLIDAQGTELPSANNNKELLYMATKSVEYSTTDYQYYPTGYAVLRDKTDPTQYMVARIEGQGYQVDIQYETLSTNSKLAQASDYALLEEDENMLYFVSDNQVYSYNLSNQFERLQFSPPAGEEVTFIRHRKYNEDGYSFNYVMVGTQAGAEYKVRMFEKASGNLNTQPAVILEGKGQVGDVIYVSPRVSSYTYPSSF